MINKNSRCEICNSLEECNCFCECGLPHNECICDMTIKDWDNWSKQLEKLKEKNKRSESDE